MTTWQDVELFTVDNPGISSAELAARHRHAIRAQMIAEGRVVGRRSRKQQGKAQQLTIDL